MDNSKFQKIFEELSTLSFYALGYSSPNPPVACVITDEELNILVKSYTQKIGFYHAEKEAYRLFNDLQIKNKKHLVFVTLEPCTHFGKTPPCIDLILNYKPIELFYGLNDINPLVTKRNGIEECIKIGIKVTSLEDLKKIGESYIGGFLRKIKNKKPKIFIKSALSKEGNFTDKKSNISITCSSSNEINQLIRAKIDGIIVGPKTVEIDSPGLNFKGTLSVIDKIKFNPKEVNYFYNTLFNQFNEFITHHNKYYSDYQPFRIFIIDSREPINQKFIEKQEHINSKLKSSKLIFINLLSVSGDVFNDELSAKYKVYSTSIENLYHTILTVCNEYQLNSLLVEGGNLLYKLFSDKLTEGDSVISIRSNIISIPDGCKPSINFSGLRHYTSFQIKNNDEWNIYIK